MIKDNATDLTIYKVVLNHEEQYSIWPAERDNPIGWRDDGKSGAKAECLAYIDKVWTDMRPLSLRQFMQENARRINDSVHPFTQDFHPVQVDWLNVTPQQIKETIDKGFIPIAFTEVPNLPGVGIMLDEATDVSGADFEGGSGSLHLEGNGNIYAVGTVRVVANLDLASMSGQARLTVLEPAKP